MKLAILDRDGVINRERGDHTWLAEDFELLEGTPKAVKALVKQGWNVAIVTNQSGVGTGKYGHGDVQAMFSIIRRSWRTFGAVSYHEYYCPHHPIGGKCLCRKPGSLLLERAISRNKANRTSTFFVGDREKDMDAARGAGIEGLLFPANSDLYNFLIEKGKIRP